MWRAFMLAAVLALAACGGDDEGSADVVVGFYPLAWAAQEVAGGREVLDLTPAGAEPHDLELSARDVEAVRDAELVLYVGGGFQPALEDAVAERDGESFDALEGRSGDPHVWLDPQQFGRIVSLIADRLNAGAEAGDTVGRITALDREYRRGLTGCERRAIVTTHMAFGHLAERYRLEQVALAGSSPEAEPSPRELERLVEQVERTGATTVFAEPLVSDRLAQTVAREAGATVATLDPLEGLSQKDLDAGEDYLSVMRENLAALRKGLGCR